jgi:cob(I)alamin adenosyltransferase
MGNRLTKIYTRKGDDGSTGLATGERIGKDSLLMKAQGDVDELNSSIACIRSTQHNKQVEDLLVAIQHHLFNIGGELSAPQCKLTNKSDIDWLERWIDFFNEDLPPLEEFILPGSDTAVAHCHVARTVCRRAERSVVEWSRNNVIRIELIQYINRLSDLLFVLSRVLESNQNCAPSYWNKDLVLPEPNK